MAQPGIAMLMLLDSSVMVTAMPRENELTASVATTASISCDDATRLPWPRKPGVADETVMASKNPSRRAESLAGCVAGVTGRIAAVVSPLRRTR